MPEGNEGYFTEYVLGNFMYIIVNETKNEAVDRYLLESAKLDSFNYHEVDKDSNVNAYNIFLKLKMPEKEAFYNTCLADIGSGFEVDVDGFKKVCDDIEKFLVKREPDYCIGSFYKAQETVLSQICENEAFATGEIKFIGEI